MVGVMGKIVCEFGVEHGLCRCMSDHVEKIVCKVPDLHKNDGEWLAESLHKCNLPKLQVTTTHTASLGDQWRCNTCNQVWTVVGFVSGTSWNPSPTTIKWSKES